MIGSAVFRVVASARRRGGLRLGWLWWSVAVLLVVLAWGCQQGGGRTVQVGDSPPGAVGDVSSEGTAVPSGPGDDIPGPGEGPGPVGDTGDEPGDGPGVKLGVGDRSGGLRLVAPDPPYLGLTDEIFDLCDDAQAYAVLYGRFLGPGEEMTVEEFDAIAWKRQVGEVSCGAPGGRRYVYMGDYGPGGAFTTALAATEDYNDRNRYTDSNRIIRPSDIPLGYFGHLDWTFTLEDIDEVRVIPDSVLVRDGVVRGLVRNFSKTLFGREVTVTASSGEGKESLNNNAVPVKGRFPLTVQPGERAPFEIEGWTGSTDPADFVLEVAAKMSTNVDITRSFSFGSGGTVTTRAVDEEFLKGFVPDFVYQTEKQKIPEDGRFNIELISVDLTAPTSHPSLKDKVLNQSIEDLRVYMALGGEKGIIDIIEPPLHAAVANLDVSQYPPVYSLPTFVNGAPFRNFRLVFIPDYTWHIWVGEPGPLDYNPRTPPTPSTTVTVSEQQDAPQMP